MSLKFVDGVPTMDELLADPPGLVVVSVDSVTVDVGHVAAQLQAFLDLPRERRPVVIMSFGGYESDPREVDQIPEVRQWCRRFLDGPTGSTLVVLADETNPPDNHLVRMALEQGVGRCKFLILAGYGERVDDGFVRLSAEGQALAVALSQMDRGEVS